MTITRPHITHHAIERAMERWRVRTPQQAREAIMEVVRAGEIKEDPHRVRFRLKRDSGRDWVLHVIGADIVTVTTACRGSIHTQKNKRRLQRRALQRQQQESAQ